MKIDKKQREHFCESLRRWSQLMIEREENEEGDGYRFAKAVGIVDMAISKSCLLDRMIYGGEKLSQTPCPVHKGRWSGCHAPWPGQFWVDAKGNRTQAEPDVQLQKWYDAGASSTAAAAPRGGSRTNIVDARVNNKFCPCS